MMHDLRFSAGGGGSWQSNGGRPEHGVRLFKARTVGYWSVIREAEPHECEADIIDKR